MRSTRRRFARRRKTIRRYRGGAEPNVVAPKPNKIFFNAHGARHRNVELNTAFAKQHHEEIQKELQNLEKKHLVHSVHNN